MSSHPLQCTMALEAWVMSLLAIVVVASVAGCDTSNYSWFAISVSGKLGHFLMHDHET
jgi:accessory gene regulator protein AgrB